MQLFQSMKVKRSDYLTNKMVSSLSSSARTAE